MMNQRHTGIAVNAHDEEMEGYIYGRPCTPPFEPGPISIPEFTITTSPISGRPEARLPRPGR